jgi:hypothetical protein
MPKDGGKDMTVVMTGEGSTKIPPSIFKMVFYKLNCG